MKDEARLKELAELCCAATGWEAKSSFSMLYYTSRSLMIKLGGFDALMQAEPDDILRWLKEKAGTEKSAYGYLYCLRHLYGFLVDQGYLADNPASALKIHLRGRSNGKRLRPPVDLVDLRKVFVQGKKRTHTLEGARTYAALCLKVRCGVQYAAMSKCRVADLLLDEACGSLIATSSRGPLKSERVYYVDEETTWSLRNYLSIRGHAKAEEPLLARSGRGCKNPGGFYQDSSLSCDVARLFERCDLDVRDYDLEKTMVLLAYSEGANIVQAATLAGRDSVTLATRVAEELPSSDLDELRRKVLMSVDDANTIAAGMIRSEEVMKAVLPAYRSPYLKIVIGADGWARFEIPDDTATHRASS